MYDFFMALPSIVAEKAYLIRHCEGPYCVRYFSSLGSKKIVPTSSLRGGRTVYGKSYTQAGRCKWPHHENRCARYTTTEVVTSEKCITIQYNELDNSFTETHTLRFASI